MVPLPTSAAPTREREDNSPRKGYSHPGTQGKRPRILRSTLAVGCGTVEKWKLPARRRLPPALRKNVASLVRSLNKRRPRHAGQLVFRASSSTSAKPCVENESGYPFCVNCLLSKTPRK